MLPTNPLLNATAPAGPHLPAATLRQYAAGTLAPAARHRVEAHTLACPRCADVLEGLLQTPAATTDQALAQLQQRLRRRVQQAEATRPVAGRLPLRPRWVGLQLAAAATLLFGLVAGGWWTWQQRHPGLAEATTKAQVNPPTSVASATEAAPVAAPATTRPLASASAHPAETTGLAVARRRGKTKLGQDDGLVVNKKCYCGAPVDLGAEREKEEHAVAELAQSLREEATATPAAQSSGTIAVDSSVLQTHTARGTLAKRSAPLAAPAALVRDQAMPAVAPIPPAPVGGYAAWREKLRQAATEFRPAEPERPVSGSVQLRLLIGADGKIQEVRVLHGLRDDYDAEAQRLVCDGPGWVPGIGGGKRAAQVVEVAVPF